MDLLFLTGQRIGDVLAIRRAALSEEGISFEQQKTGARLVVLWTPELRDTVARARLLYANVRAFTLLHNRRGKVPDYRTVKDQWDKACVACGVENAHLHDVRAMALTAAKLQGKDPTALAGHSSQAMTERYLRDRTIPMVEGPSFRRLLGRQS
jgi:integrase